MERQPVLVEWRSAEKIPHASTTQPRSSALKPSYRQLLFVAVLVLKMRGSFGSGERYVLGRGVHGSSKPVGKGKGEGKPPRSIPIIETLSPSESSPPSHLKSSTRSPSHSGSQYPPTTSAAPSTSPAPTGLSSPSLSPSTRPTPRPQQPTSFPNYGPSHFPSIQPSPSSNPQSSSSIPSARPTGSPVSAHPSSSPDHSLPPSFRNTISIQPSRYPSTQPSFQPTKTAKPSVAASNEPTALPSSRPSLVPSSSPSSGPTLVLSSTADICQNNTLDRREEFWFKYSVELGVGVLDPSTSINLLELSILELIKDDLLSCGQPQRKRKLVANFGIGGIDHSPSDELLDEECPEPKDSCLVYRGLMDLYLEPGTDTDNAVYESRYAIQALMMESSLLAGVVGIDRVEYLAPVLDETSAVEGSAGINSEPTTGRDSLTSGFLIVVALGSLFFVVAAIIGYRYKRQQQGDKQLDSPTLASASQITGINSNLSGELDSSPRPSTREAAIVPSFSAMMPDSYQLRTLHTMSAILENDSDSSQTHSDIIVSESGYSEENSRDSSYLESLHQLATEPVLGAHRMEDYDEEDLLFDIGSEFPLFENEEETIEFYPA